MAPSKKFLDALNNFQTDDDIRQQLIDSIISRLELRNEQMKREMYEIATLRAYMHWALIIAMLVIFCILRYGVEKVDLRRGGAYTRYKERQLQMTSHAFKLKQKKD